jgi:hypothetical protein
MKPLWQLRNLALQTLMIFILALNFIPTDSIYAQTKSKNLRSSKKSRTSKKKRRKKIKKRRKKKKKSFRGYETGYGYVDDQLDEKSKFFKITYNIMPKDSFALILKRLTKSGVRINATTPSVRAMKKANPHIQNWELLPPKTKITVYIAKKDAEIPRVAYHFKLYDVQEERKRIAFEKRFGYNAFYMASAGTYNQVNTKEDVNYNLPMNSPVSAGILYHFPSPQYNIMYSTSFYFSLFSGVQSETATESVTPPIEFGVNYYAQFYLAKFMPYFGVDFETLSSFNSDVFKRTFAVEFDKHQILYLTGGLTYTWKMFKKPFLMKWSISPSIMTNTVSSTGSTGKNYSGYKTILYINSKIHKKYFLHGMVKLHQMADEEELSILRIGIGGGYIF